MNADEIRAYFPGYAGWGEAEMMADFRATGGSGKGGGGGIGGGVNIPPAPDFSPGSSAYKSAETKALAELTPYYEKLLQMYGGDVALAKQRLDQDYERGLRVKTSNTQWESEAYDIEKQERDRKFQIALTDLDQQLNTRGVFNSGIRDTERTQARADEAYQIGQIERNQQSLQRGLEQYTEQAGADYTKGAQDLGYMKPTGVATTGQFAPSQTGIVSPGASYNIANYASQPAQKELELAEQKKKDLATKIANDRAQAYEQWYADAQRLSSSSPNA